MSEDAKGAEPENDESPGAGTPRPSENESSPTTVAPGVLPVNPSTLDAALGYVRRGWSVAPVVPGTKHPAVTIAPFLSGKTKWTEDEVRAWWTGNPDHSVAIIMGAPSGLIAIDVDPRNGASLEENVRDVPTGLVAQTGGGGLHLFCRHPGGHIPKGKTTRPGVDRQSDGSFVVAAPSVHPSGGLYQWRNEGEPGELPAWAIEKAPGAHDHEPGEPRPPWIADTLANPRACAPGTQEDTLYRLAWHFACQVSAGKQDYDIALGSLTGWLLSVPVGNPQDPWTADHAKERLDRAIAKLAQRPASFDASLAESSGGAAAGALLEALTEVARSIKRPPKAREGSSEDAIARVVAACRSAQDRSKDQEPEIEWIVPLLLPRGVLVDLHGDVKAGKSTLVAYIVRAIVEGTDIFGQGAQKGRVIWFTEQPRATFTQQLRECGLAEHPDLLVLYSHEVLAATWAERVAGLMQVATREGQKADVLVVDTFSKLAGIRGDDENSSGAQTDACDELEPLKAAGIAVVLVCHDRKSGGTNTTAGRGSNAVAGEADIIYGILKEEQLGQTARRLRYDGRLSQIPSERIIRLENGRYSLANDDDSKRLAQAIDWAAITEAAPRVSAHRVKAAELGARVSGLGVNKFRARLTEYRDAVAEGGKEGIELEPGGLCFEGKDGRGGYWRACRCRIVLTEGRGSNVGAMLFEADPDCEGHEPGGGAEGNSTTSQPLGIDGGREVGTETPGQTTTSPGGDIRNKGVPSLEATSRVSRIPRGREVVKSLPAGGGAARKQRGTPRTAHPAKNIRRAS